MSVLFSRTIASRKIKYPEFQSEIAYDNICVVNTEFRKENPLFTLFVVIVPTGDQCVEGKGLKTSRKSWFFLCFSHPCACFCYNPCHVVLESVISSPVTSSMLCLENRDYISFY